MSYELVWFLSMTLMGAGLLVGALVQASHVLQTTDQGLRFVRAAVAVVAIILGGVVLTSILGGINPDGFRAEFLQQLRQQP